MQGARSHQITVGAADAARTIAVLHRDGAAPAVMWLGGFMSDMVGTKANALDAWGGETGRAVLRFDYSGHGASGGALTAGTVGRWLGESESVAARFAGRQPVLVGSSLGGWLALLLALRLGQAGAPPAGLVLIAPAVDMTERLMWAAFPEEARRAIREQGVWERPSAYGDGPYPITRDLIDEGRAHLLLERSGLALGCPVHILHGRDDPDVPLDLSFELAAALAGDDVTLTVVHDGDHRLSRPDDIALLIRAVAAMAEPAHAPSPAA